MTDTLIPRPGRHVDFWPSVQGANAEPEKPYAAIVADVASPEQVPAHLSWAPYVIHVSYFDRFGVPHGQTEVPLVEPGTAINDQYIGPIASWMPYQVGQAAKTEEAASIGDARADAIETALNDDIRAKNDAIHDLVERVTNLEAAVRHMVDQWPQQGSPSADPSPTEKAPSTTPDAGTSSPPSGESSEPSSSRRTVYEAEERDRCIAVIRSNFAPDTQFTPPLEQRSTDELRKEAASYG